MKLFDSLTFGSAFLVVGLILLMSAGAAESGNVLQEALNALWQKNSSFHSIALLGFSLSLIGSILLIYWILFGNSNNASSNKTK